MKLFYGPASPFVRKVMVAAIELGLDGQIELERLGLLNAAQPNPQLAAVNPLAKIPALVLDDRRVLFDSNVICEYLDSLGGRTLFPAPGDDRWRALTRVAAADGLLEAAMLARAEKAQPAAQQVPEWIAGQLGKARQCLDMFEQQAGLEEAGTPDIGDIGVACALGWLDFRMPEENWREGRARLANWFDGVSRRRSLQATQPAAPPA